MRELELRRKFIDPASMESMMSEIVRITLNEYQYGKLQPSKIKPSASVDLNVYEKGATADMSIMREALTDLVMIVAQSATSPASIFMCASKSASELNRIGVDVVAMISFSDALDAVASTKALPIPSESHLSNDLILPLASETARSLAQLLRTWLDLPTVIAKVPNPSYQLLVGYSMLDHMVAPDMKERKPASFASFLAYGLAHKYYNTPWPWMNLRAWHDLIGHSKGLNASVGHFKSLTAAMENFKTMGLS